MKDPFSINLATLCSYLPSIAEVCRRLSINRQQFNKYLSGQARPSRNSMRRICDLFGVTEAEMHMDPDKFDEIVSLRRRPVRAEDVAEPLRHIDRIYQASQDLGKYTGYYFRYFFSFGNPGYVVRSLAVLYKSEQRYFWKNFEITRDPVTRHMQSMSKYEGAAFYLADRITVIEYETLERNSITQMTLYPSHRHRLDRLVGIQTGGPLRRGRRPGASRVALEFIGREINIRNALRQCAYFREDSGEIRADMLDLIRNTMGPGAHVFEVDEP